MVKMVKSKMEISYASPPIYDPSRLQRTYNDLQIFQPNERYTIHPDGTVERPDGRRMQAIMFNNGHDWFWYPGSSASSYNHKFEPIKVVIGRSRL